MNLERNLRSAGALVCTLFGCYAAQAVESNNVLDEQDEALAGLAAASAGVSTWQVAEPYLNLWIFDQPLTYQTSYGQPIGFGVAFKQRDNRSNGKIFGLGPGWESSWLSYVEYTLDASTPPKATAGTNYVALGGARNYVADGLTKEFKSSSTMTTLTNGGGTFTGFQVNLPSGARDIYGYLLAVSAGENYALLSQHIDAVGHTNTLNYDTISSVVRLRSMVDSDNRTNSVLYSATYTNQISEVDGPYGTKATFGYDGSGRLSTITNMGGMVDAFSYDSQSLITNLVTAYGTNSFKCTTNAFGSVNLGGTNQVNRSVLVTEADGNKQLFMYRDSSSLLNATSSVPLLPSSYASGDVPVTSPLTNTFDNTVMDARNSFHWNQQQYAGLNGTFRTSGSFNDLTTNDYNIAVLRHWLRGYTNAALVSQSLSLQRDPSPEGTTVGQKTWYDYAGKVSNWSTRGTNAQPVFVALVLPDGTTRYTYSERNQWEKPTRTVDTYSNGGSASYRTNNFAFTTDGIDLVKAIGPSNELLSSNAYNGFHQVVTNYNGVNDLAVYAYDSNHRITVVQWPSGLGTTNSYFSSGSHIGWLNQAMDFETTLANAYRTNTFTYTNGLVLTLTDPRGLVTTNSYDSLLRLTSLTSAAGTTNNAYSNLDLARTILPSGTVTNAWGYDPLRRLCQITDPRNNVTSMCYVSGMMCAVTNALGQTNSYTYDFGGRQLSMTYADGTSTTYRYNLLGQKTNVTDAGGASLTNWFTNQGLPYTSSNGFGQVFLKTYDLRDRVTNAVDANGVAVTIVYDNLSRVLTRTYPDGGVEKYGYSARGLTVYSNQLGFATHYGYDALGRKTAETNGNAEVTQYAYNSGSDLITLTDGKTHRTQWGYDQFGRNTNVIDNTGTTILRFSYNQDGRLTNRWSAAKGNTAYTTDLNGNVTQIGYPASTAVSYIYDALNRVTSMTDAAGITGFSYTSTGRLATEDGPWDNDTVTLSYGSNGDCGCSASAGHLRTALSLAQPNASPWSMSYAYDNANRLQTLTAPPGTFTYTYQTGSLIKKLLMPTGAYITNTFDSVARMASTVLESSGSAILNSHSYTYNTGSQRTQQTRTDGSYATYTYDNAGQLKTAVGKESGGSTRAHETFGYAYDAADNLNYRTNNALVQTFTVDGLNQLSSVARSGTLTVSGTVGTPGTNVTSVTVAVNGNAAVAATVYGDKTFARAGVTVLNGNNTFTAVAQDAYGRKDTNSVTVNLPSSVSYSYDANGNLTSDGTRTFTYDDENQLASVSVGGSWSSTFVYDGRNRLRIRREYIWQSSAWVQTGETHYVYDGNTVIQERDANNTPKVTYTRGIDLGGLSSCSGAMDTAGGIGGLLARTDNALWIGGGGDPYAYYHADANGNVTALVNSKQQVAAKYLYDPFGNAIAKAGALADANAYRFSSKEYHSNSDLYYFGRRFYDPNLQRWPNRDPIGIADGVNSFEFVSNDPINQADPTGLVNWISPPFKKPEWPMHQTWCTQWENLPGRQVPYRWCCTVDYTANSFIPKNFVQFAGCISRTIAGIENAWNNGTFGAFSSSCADYRECWASQYNF